MMNSIREMKGVPEDDEDGLVTMFMEFMGAGGPPGGGEADDDEISEEWSEDDEDMDEDDENLGESTGTRLARFEVLAVRVDTTDRVFGATSRWSHWVRCRKCFGSSGLDPTASRTTTSLESEFVAIAA